MKRGAVGTKLHHRVAPFDFDGGFDLEALRDATEGDGGELLAAAVLELAAFTDADGRVTFAAPALVAVGSA